MSEIKFKNKNIAGYFFENSGAKYFGHIIETRQIHSLLNHRDATGDECRLLPMFEILKDRKKTLQFIFGSYIIAKFKDLTPGSIRISGTLFLGCSCAK